MEMDVTQPLNSRRASCIPARLAIDTGGDTTGTGGVLTLTDIIRCRSRAMGPTAAGNGYCLDGHPATPPMVMLRASRP